jgi:type I restriction enzyme, S subunit
MEVKPGYKLSDVGEIPAEWDVTDCADLCMKIQDGTHFSPQIRGNDHLYLTSKNVRFGFLDISTADRIDSAQHEAIYRRCDVKYGDLLLTKDGANTGNAALNNLTEQFSLLSSVAFLRFDPKKHSAAYLLQQMLSPDGQARMKEAMSGNAITRLTLEKIRKLRFPVAPLREQRAISAALSDADALLSGLDRLIAKKRDLKQAAMQQLPTGQTRLPGFSGEWVTAPLGEHCEAITKGTTPTSIGKSFATSGTNFLKAESLGEGGDLIFEKVAYIDDDTHRLLKRSQLKSGDLLLSIAGVIGRVGKVREEHLPANTNQALAIVRLRTCSDIERDFLFFFLRSPHATKQMSDVNVQAAQSNISLKNVSELQVFFPPTREEQFAIANVLVDFETEITALEARRNKTHALKQAMMQELLTGRIRLVAPEPKAELQT